MCSFMFNNKGLRVFYTPKNNFQTSSTNGTSKSVIWISHLNTPKTKFYDPVPHRIGNRSAEIQRLVYLQKQMISCINRKRSPFKIKPFSDIYCMLNFKAIEENWTSRNVMGIFKTRIPSPKCGREIGHQKPKAQLGRKFQDLIELLTKGQGL